MDLYKMSGQEFMERYEKHALWLKDNNQGEQLILKNIEFSFSEFQNLNLQKSIFTGCNFGHCHFDRVVLVEAGFYGCVFYNTSISMTNLNSTVLNSSFRHSIIECSTFQKTRFIDGNFSRSSVFYSRFDETTFINYHFLDSYFTYNQIKNVAGLEDSITNNTSFLNLVCPEEGSFIAFKKAYIVTDIEDEDGSYDGQLYDEKPVIVKLLIPEDAKRSSADTRKCRCDKAKVISITSLDGTKEFTIAQSRYDLGFIYEVGKEVSVDNFDDNRWNECAPGIHFFITRQEAVRY